MVTMTSNIGPTLFILLCCIALSTQATSAPATDGGGAMQTMMTMMSDMYTSGKMSTEELGNALVKLLYLLRHFQSQKPTEKSVTAETPTSTAPESSMANNSTDSEMTAASASQTNGTQSVPSNSSGTQPRRIAAAAVDIGEPLQSSLPVITLVSEIVEPSSQVPTDMSSSFTSTPVLVLPSIDPSSSIVQIDSTEMVFSSPSQLAMATSEIFASPVVQNVPVITTSPVTVAPVRRIVASQPDPIPPRAPVQSPTVPRRLVNAPANLAATTAATPGAILANPTSSEPVVGANGEWGSWSSCSPPCGGCGKRKRIRDCTVTGCIHSEQKSNCGYYACPGRRVTVEYYCYKPVACPSYKYPESSYPRDPYRRAGPDKRRPVYGRQRDPYPQPPEYRQPRSRVTPGYAFQEQNQRVSRVYRKKRSVYDRQQYPTQGPKQIGTYNINIQSGPLYDGKVVSSPSYPQSSRPSQGQTYRPKQPYPSRRPASNPYRQPVQSPPDYSYYNRDPYPVSPPVVVKPPHSNRYLEPPKALHVQEPYPKPSYPEPQLGKVPYGGGHNDGYPMKDYGKPKDVPKPHMGYPNPDPTKVTYPGGYKDDVPKPPGYPEGPAHGGPSYSDPKQNKPPGYPDGGSPYPDPAHKPSGYPDPKHSKPSGYPDIPIPSHGRPPYPDPKQSKPSGYPNIPVPSHGGPPYPDPKPRKPSGYPDVPIPARGGPPYPDPKHNKPPGYPDGGLPYPDPAQNKPPGYPDGRPLYPDPAHRNSDYPSDPRESSNRYPSGGHPKPYDDTYKRPDPIYRTKTGTCVAYTMCQTQYDAGKYCCEGRKIQGEMCVIEGAYARNQRYYDPYNRSYK